MKSRVALVFAVVVACGGSSSSSDAPPPSPGSGSDDAGGSSSGPSHPGDASAPSSDASTPPTGGSDASAPADAAPSMPGPDATSPSGSVPTLPKPTGTCPTIAPGNVTFSPAGIPPRTVALSMSATAPAKPGPLIVYWYATGSSTLEVPYALGATLTAIEAAGGVVAAPQADPNAGQFEWYVVNGSTKQDDFLVADEIVACLAQAGRIDPTHIHSMGMSAGALQTTYLSFVRSSYLASVTTYSGGILSGEPVPPFEDPANKFSALLFEGGANDMAFGVDFETATMTYRSTLQAAGHFAPRCDHGMGHAIPTAAAPSVWAFFQANGFGVYPSPYVNGLPSSFPSYCTIAPDAGP